MTKETGSSILDQLVQSSMGSVFSNASNQATEGNDFKRLAQKSRDSRQLFDICTASETTTPEQTRTASGHPILTAKPVILPVDPRRLEQHQKGILSTIYSVLFYHNDRYFNNDRKDLSRDIFHPDNRPASHPDAIQYAVCNGTLP